MDIAWLLRKIGEEASILSFHNTEKLKDLHDVFYED